MRIRGLARPGLIGLMTAAMAMSAGCDDAEDNGTQDGGGGVGGAGNEGGGGVGGVGNEGGGGAGNEGGVGGGGEGGGGQGGGGEGGGGEGGEGGVAGEGGMGGEGGVAGEGGMGGVAGEGGMGGEGGVAGEGGMGGEGGVAGEGGMGGEGGVAGEGGMGGEGGNVGPQLGDPCTGDLECPEEGFCAAADGDGNRVCVAHDCGDGLITGTEACDDGNDVDGDGCDACQIVGIPTGNACAVDGPACVEGNFCAADVDGNTFCAPIVCGDSVVVPGVEECDFGAPTPGCGEVDCLYETDAIRHAEPDSFEAPFAVELIENSALVLLNLQPAADVDFVRITLPDGGSIEAETSAVLDPEDCNGDTIIEIYPAGDVETRVASNDDKEFGNLCSLAAVSGLPAGDYILRISSFRDLGAGDNLLSITVTPPLLVGETCDVENDLCEASSDCIAGEGENPATCVANICGDGRLDPLVEACDDGNEDLGDGCEACALVGIPLGNACSAGGFACAAELFCDTELDEPVCAASVCGDGRATFGEQCDDGNDDETDGCQADCTVGPVTNFAAEPDSREAPYILAFGPDGFARVVTELQPAADTDWFTFTLAADAAVVIETHAAGNRGACNGDTLIDLYRDGEPAALVTDDDDGPGTCSSLNPVANAAEMTNLPAGTYQIQLRAFQNRAAGFNVLSVRVVTQPVLDGACIVDDLFTECPEGAYCAEATRLCTAHICSDGVVGPDEECDDGNLDAGDGCDDFCQFEAIPVEGDDLFTVGPFAEGESELFDFTLEAAARVRIRSSLEGAPCPDAASVDTLVTVVDRDSDDEVARNDDADGAADRCSFIEAVLPAGNYRAQVGGFGGDAVDAEVTVEFEFSPVRAAGEACDRDAQDDVCAAGLICLIQAAGNGSGLCGADPLAPIGEIEPNGTVAEAEALILTPSTRVNAAISPAGDLDIFVVDLEAETALTVSTGDGDGDCPGDTELYRIDGATFDPATFTFADDDAAALAYNDDQEGNGLCSGLSETLPAGRHYYLVKRYSGDGPGASILGSYVFSVEADGVPFPGAAPVALGGVCDATGEQNECAEGLDCIDVNNDADGRCMTVAGLVPGRGNLGSISPAGVSNAFFFSLESAANTTITTEVGGPNQCSAQGANSADTVINLYLIGADGTLTQVASNDDFGAGNCSRIAATFEPGDYVLTVRAFAAAALIPAYAINFLPLAARAEGEPCDRTGLTTACPAGQACLIDGGDGVGICGALPVPEVVEVNEIEPNNAIVEAEALIIDENTRVLAAIAVAGDFDIFVVDVASAGRVVVETSNGAGGCGFDTQLYRANPATFNPAVFGTNPAWRLAYNDDIDGSNNPCSRISEDLPAGRHYYVAKRYSGTGPGAGIIAAYALTVTLPAPGAEVGELCDPAGVQIRCNAPLACFDETGDGDGICVTP